MENSASTDGLTKERLRLSVCDMRPCNRDAYFQIDLDCDDMTANLCDKHHNELIAALGLPYGDE